MAFKFLVRHADNLIAGTLESLLEDTAFSLLDLPDSVDWGDSNSIEEGFRSGVPKVVVNLLPDDETLLDEVVLRQQKALAEACSSRNIPFIQLSSYRVFGDQCVEGGWRESDIPDPGHEEARVFLNLEKNASQLAQHIILRTGWLLEDGVLRRFVPPILGGQSLLVSDRHFGSPLSQKFVARVVLAIVQQVIFGAQNWGVFHLHSSDRCSEAEFADQIVRLLTREFNLELAQPTVGGVDSGSPLMKGCAHLLGRRCTANFGVQLPTWRSGLARIVKSWTEESLEKELAAELSH